MAVRRREHDVFLGKHIIVIIPEPCYNAGLYALGHVHKLRRDKHDGRFSVIDNKCARIKPRKQPLHKVAERVIARADIGYRAGYIYLGRADLKLAVSIGKAKGHECQQHRRTQRET